VYAKFGCFLNNEIHSFTTGNTLDQPEWQKRFSVSRNRLTDLQRSQPILIRADKDIGLQVFVDVMDVVKGLGFKKVSLQTQASIKN
jgi:biopolymer transport protein ExbD